MWQVIGQSRVISFLQRSLESGTLAHAYLLIGPPHIGKMTLAINIAQALNCETVKYPCQECDSCKKIAAMNHSDVQVIGLLNDENSTEAKLISIDQIKEIQHSASLPPFEGKEKVFIIDGADLMSTEAANCLLKILEEPTDKVTFILLTANDRLLPTTVVSRCQCLELPPLPVPEITEAIIERLNIEREQAKLFAELSRGCPGWAISAAENEGLIQHRTEELGMMIDLVNMDSEGLFKFVNQLVTRFSQNRNSVYNILDLWMNYWRDIMLVKLGCGDIITNIDRYEELNSMARNYHGSQIKTFINSIRLAMEQLRQNANPRLVLEVLMLDIPRKERGSQESWVSNNK